MSLAEQKFRRFFSPDDWGFSPAINEACLYLAQRELVDTVSISVVRGHWKVRLEELKQLRKEGKIKLALHLDLSYAACPVSKIDWWIGKNAVEMELKKQVRELNEEGIEIDSINGHRHVHLYPAVLRAVAQLNLPLRLPSDHNHPNSYFSSLPLRWGLRLRWEKVGYLNAKDLINLQLLTHKKTKFETVICHPASKHDFDEAGCDDQLRQERVDEFLSIRKVLSI